MKILQTRLAINIALIFSICGVTFSFASRQMEYLDRGLVAVRNGNEAFISWRSLATDDASMAFNIYRITGKDTLKLNTSLLTKETNFIDSNPDLTESYNDGKIEKWDYENKGVMRLETTWKIYPSSGSERGAAMFHGDILGDWREESILVNYETNELVIFTTDIPTDYRFYALSQNPAYRNHMTAKGYVQAAMLDYYLGTDMDMPQKPDIEIIGHQNEIFETIHDENQKPDSATTHVFKKIKAAPIRMDSKKFDLKGRQIPKTEENIFRRVYSKP